MSDCIVRKGFAFGIAFYNAQHSNSVHLKIYIFSAPWSFLLFYCLNIKFFNKKNRLARWTPFTIVLGSCTTFKVFWNYTKGKDKNIDQLHMFINDAKCYWFLSALWLIVMYNIFICAICAYSIVLWNTFILLFTISFGHPSIWLYENEQHGHSCKFLFLWSTEQKYIKVNKLWNIFFLGSILYIII